MVNNSSQYKHFVRFLKERKCYHRFKTEQYKSSTIKSTPLYEHVPSLYVMAAFKWADTPQGNTFWHQMHTEWRQCLTYHRL